MQTLIEFYAAHKGSLVTLAGIAAALLAPKLGTTPEHLDAEILSIGGMVVAYVGSHNWQKAKAADAPPVVTP